MAGANPLWGAPRIHGELVKLRFDVSERTVSRLMPRRRKPPSMTRSTQGFCQGEPGAVSSSGKDSRSCWRVHADVGCPVTLTCKMRRLLCGSYAHLPNPVRLSNAPRARQGHPRGTRHRSGRLWTGPGAVRSPRAPPSLRTASRLNRALLHSVKVGSLWTSATGLTWHLRKAFDGLRAEPMGQLDRAGRELPWLRGSCGRSNRRRQVLAKDKGGRGVGHYGHRWWRSSIRAGRRAPASWPLRTPPIDAILDL